MSDDLTTILDMIGEPSGSKPVPAERFEQFGDIVPPLLLETWRRVGFAGFNRGLFWLCDPVAWAPAVTAWTTDLDVGLSDDTWHAIGRDAFGSVQLWGERTGLSLNIEPVHGMIFPTAGSIDEMDDERSRDIQIESMLVVEATSRGLLGEDEKPLFDRAVAKHGEVGPDTMYTFVPARALGGHLTVDHIEIADAPTHVELLASLGQRTVMTDVTRVL